MHKYPIASTVTVMRYLRKAALCLAASAGLWAGLAAAQTESLRTETVASGLEHPWAVAFLPEGGFLVTERPGRLRVVSAKGQVSPPVGGLPAIDARGQGGLLDLVLDSAFASNRQLYFCYAEPGESGNSTAMARALSRAPLCQTSRPFTCTLPRVGRSVR